MYCLSFRELAQKVEQVFAKEIHCPIILGTVSGIIIGAVIAFAVVFSLTSLDSLYWFMFTAIGGWLYIVGIPVLIGGLVAGAIARHHGWIAGLTATFLYLFLHIDFIDFWHNDWLSLTLGMMVGTYGGFLGGGMAQIWHKRLHRKSDASQSENK